MGGSGQAEKRFAFPKNERISSSSEIRALFQRGKRASVPGAKLFFARNSLGCARFGISLPRKYGRAVDRNRTKRLCRESFRLQKARFAPGYDMLFLVYPQQGEDFRVRGAQIFTLARKAGLVKAHG